jgi:hypothetical protein
VRVEINVSISVQLSLSSSNRDGAATRARFFLTRTLDTRQQPTPSTNHRRANARENAPLTAFDRSSIRWSSGSIHHQRTPTDADPAVTKLATTAQAAVPVAPPVTGREVYHVPYTVTTHAVRSVASSTRLCVLVILQCGSRR